MNTKLNKSDYIVIAIVYVVSILVNSLDYYQEGNMLKEYFVDFSVGTLTSLCAVLLFMYWIIPNFLVRQQKYFHFVFFGLLVLFFNGIIDYTAGFWSGDNDWSKYPKGLKFFLTCLFRVTDDTGLVLGILLTKKFYEGQKELADIQKQQKENELKLLRSQLDPHFLFNNLNTLDSLIDYDTTKAKEYINRLSLIYRYLIKTKDAEVMELSKEVDFAENYIFLIQTRFANDYDFRLLKNAPLENKFIPTGALQALLENVVKHNKPQNNNTVNSEIIIDENWLTITNEKSNFKQASESLRTGLENLKARYKLLSDQEVQIINTETEFKVSIPIIKLSKDL
jgi:hypothetical protein